VLCSLSEHDPLRSSESRKIWFPSEINRFHLWPEKGEKRKKKDFEGKRRKQLTEYILEDERQFKCQPATPLLGLFPSLLLFILAPTIPEKIKPVHTKSEKFSASLSPGCF
jgi:hypothetical protein